jgi:hypothetical protein
MERLAFARRRSYEDEMRTPLHIHTDHKADDVFPRNKYKHPMVIECIILPDTRIEAMHAALDRCKERMDRLTARLDIVEQSLRNRYAE